MLKRFYYVFAVPWALLLTLLVFTGSDEPNLSAWLIFAIGPLAVPAILGRTLRYVIFGSFRRLRWVPYRQP